MPVFQSMATAGAATGEHRAAGIAIIGAGFGGIGLAIRLKRAGIKDFVLFEQASDIGGTWRDNTYPGCACDIPSILYSFSFAARADWSRRYPIQEEIQAYLRDCVTREGLWPHIRLGVALRGAAFDPTIAGWRLRLDPGEGRTVQTLVLAAGALHVPALPRIPGLDLFQGHAFHSAHWDHGVDLTGKRVAVIGTGASAVQFLPRIAGLAAALTVFQRTPSWVLPKQDPPTTEMGRSILRYVPLARRMVRAWQYWTHEARAIGFLGGTWLLKVAERRARTHAKRQIADDATRERLTPDYRIGCKRILLSNDFLPVFNRPTVTLETAPIARITRNGVETVTGLTYLADVLIFATGFQATDPLAGIQIVGRDGQSLAAAWRNGMRAWLGVAVTGFPNLFLLAGPNTGLGHNSVVFMLEAQIGHILRCLRRMRRRGAAVIEVWAAVEHRFNAWLDQHMQRTVWLSGCRSWYLDRAGRNTTLWPGFSAGYWLRLRGFTAHAYRLSGLPPRS